MVGVCGVLNPSAPHSWHITRHLNNIVPQNQQTSHATYYDFTFRLLTFCHMPKSSLLQRLYAAFLACLPTMPARNVLAFKICLSHIEYVRRDKINHRGSLQFLVRLLCSHTLNAHILRRKYPSSYLFLNGSHFTWTKRWRWWQSSRKYTCSKNWHFASNSKTSQ